MNTFVSNAAAVLFGLVTLLGLVCVLTRRDSLLSVSVMLAGVAGLVLALGPVIGR